MPNTKNIWIAAGDNDIERVQILLDQGVSPDAKDDNDYTPMHAAASYGNHDVLRLLVKSGGNINITDGDGETPLFVVESVRDAELVVGLGGDPNHKNDEGISAAEYHAEENPAVARFLASMTGATLNLEEDAEISLEQDRSMDAASDALLQRFQQVMQNAQDSGTDPEPALREIVQESVQGVADLGVATGASTKQSETSDSKRRRDDPER